MGKVYAVLLVLFLVATCIPLTLHVYLTLGWKHGVKNFYLNAWDEVWLLWGQKS